MASTSSDTRCRGCGGDVPVVEVMGRRLELPYCEDCGAAEREREDAEQRARFEREALDRAGETERLRPLILATYPVELGPQLAKAREWLADYEAGGRRNLWMTGEVGSGKTGLAWGLVREAALDAVDRFYATPEDDRGDRPSASAMLVNWRDLLADIRAGYDAKTGGTQGADVYDRARRVRLLALDDLGAERPTPWALEQLASLVQARYDRTLPTIVTSNYSSRDLTERLGTDETVLGLRVVSRLLEGAVGIRFENVPNRRKAA